MSNKISVVNGSKIYIGGIFSPVDDPTNMTQADYADITWTQIKKWASAGELGITQELIEQGLIDTNFIEAAKGTLTGGTATQQFVPAATDPGQIALLEASKDACNNFAFKIEWAGNCAGAEPEGMTDFFYGLVLPRNLTAGEVNTSLLHSFDIRLNSVIVTV